MGKNKFKNKNNKKFIPHEEYVAPGNKEDLDRPIEDLKLSEHAYNALINGGVKVLNDLCIQRMSKMYRIQNIGKKDCIEIANKLKQFNLAFRPEEVKQNVEPNKQNAQPQQNNNQQKAPQQQKQNNNQQQKQNNNQPKVKLNFSIFDDKALAEYINGVREREIVKWEDENQQKPSIIKFCRNGKWGFKDPKGNVLINPIYEGAYQFSEDMACVEKDGKLGFINRAGDLVVDFIYDGATSFSDGLASVTVGEKSGYIDKEGNIVFEIKYKVATPFNEGKALIKEDDKWGVLDKDGSIYWR